MTIEFFQPLSLILAIIGAAIFLFTRPEWPRVIRFGEIMYAVGLFCFLFLVKGKQ